MAFIWMFLSVLLSFTAAAEIELLECEPPDIPDSGGYGPEKSYYIPGDVIHYFCDVDTYIGGNYYRRCLDTGDWTGDTPVCDAPSGFQSVSQTSDSDDESVAQAAVDGIRSTCSATIGGQRDQWSGNFSQSGELIRVMLFLPKGPVSYEVFLVKQNGDELSCGSQTKNIDRLEWTFHNCPGPHNRDATGIKIKSLSDEPLRMCEIVTHVLTSPTCVDPRHRIENGRLRLTRKTATLVCDRRYTKSRDKKLECVRDGEWTRKTLYCLERQWELDDREPVDDDIDGEGGMDPRREPNRSGP